MHATREQGLHVRYFPTLDSFIQLSLYDDMPLEILCIHTLNMVHMLTMFRPLDFPIC